MNFKTCIATVILMLTALTSQIAFAASAADILAPMKKARENLVALLDTADKGVQTNLINDIHAASAEADKAIETVLNDAATPADVKAKVTEAKTTWEEFKKTREEEIIPKVQNGDAAGAKEIATGIQKERFKKLVTLLQ